MNAAVRDPAYERDRESWYAASNLWLHRVFPALAESARHVAHGDRGVIELTMNTPDMKRMLAAAGSIRVSVDLCWHPADNFVTLVNDPANVGPETGRRWGNMLAVMDPTSDVALFLHSTPNVDGRWFLRFLVVHDGKMPAQ